MRDFFTHFHRDEPIMTKHEIIVEGVIDAISRKQVKMGQALPSLHAFMTGLSCSRMTILKALNELKDRGIVESKYRVGYFVKNVDISQQLKVMLILTEFNPYHETLYYSLLRELKGENIAIDLFFHHGNSRVFTAVLKEHIGKYGMYLITPIPDQQVVRLMDTIPEHKLLQIVRPVCSKKEISFISQDFYGEVIDALETISDRVKKYEGFVLVYPQNCFHPPEIVKAFRTFCDTHGIRHSVLPGVEESNMEKDLAYFVINDSHLITVIKQAEARGWKLGRDIGIISYNDTPMKEIIRQGITVITTDFNEIGKLAARYILTREPVKQVVKTKIKLRNSL